MQLHGSFLCQLWQLHIEQYMAGLIPAGGDPIPPDVADETCEGEDAETVQDFDDFKQWLKANEAVGEAVELPVCPTTSVACAVGDGDALQPMAAASSFPGASPTVGTKCQLCEKAVGECPLACKSLIDTLVVR